MVDRNERADRILDAAGDLLTRMGYRKVTIDDIARRAGIGKGTVYLHWRTKRQLFDALLIRESIRSSTAIVELLRDDPAQARPHRFLRDLFTAVREQPLLEAIFTGDPELLGTLADASQHKRALVHADELYPLLRRHRLVRAEIPNLQLAIEATITGFLLAPNVNTTLAELPLTTRQDALADTIRHAFEPDTPPTPDQLRVAAAELVALFETSLAAYRDEVYPPGSAG